MSEPFYEVKQNNLMRVFDKRGVFIIQTPTKIFIWSGSRLNQNSKN
jgi:hypothetical protein